MLFRIGGLGPESFDKYSKYASNFNEITSFVSDSKAAISLFAKSLNCQIEQIPVLANKKRYATKNGKTISNVNQLHSEFSILITKKHGVSTRHLQSYLNWLLFIKKIRYTVKDTARSSHIYMETMHQGNTIKVRDICKQEFPIDLFMAYGDYKYRVFS